MKINLKLLACFLIMITGVINVYLVAVQLTPEEKCFYDDCDTGNQAVNEGELRFVSPITDKNILHSKTLFRNLITTCRKANTR